MSKPFIKWAGGKTQLLSAIKQRYPTTCKKYCEPFVGGGAVLFDLLENYEPEQVLINDSNKEVMNVFECIKSNLTQLLEALYIIKERYCNASEEAKRNLYYEARGRFNQLKLACNANDNLEKAKLFIFLNKTCFNGLYRENASGEFNVPFNNAKNPAFYDEPNIIACSKLLQNVTINSGDYRSCFSFIDADTFVYIDPPYRPLTKTASFTTYTRIGFSEKDQKDLAAFVKRCCNKGAKVLVSESDPHNINEHDDFFDKLYAGYKIERVEAGRAINSKGNKRGRITELLISSY